MIIQLLLASCQPPSVASTHVVRTPPATGDAKTGVEMATPVSVKMPQGQAVVRECYAQADRPSRRKSYGANKSASPPPPPVMSPPSGATGAAAPTAPAAKPMVTATAPAREERKADAGRATATKEKAEPMVAEAAPADSLQALGYAGSGDGGGGQAEQSLAGAGTQGLAGVGKKGLADKDLSAGDDESEMAARPRAASTGLDWGAQIYLSNDDSMSLASAQRLLWAVQNKGPVRTAEVRPHEFLNYFSFDTADLSGGDTFSVLASAEETVPGTLTMAVAVKGATPARAPLDLTLVLDRSGSMSAEGRMEYLKRGLTKMTDSLQRGDRVDLVLFDNTVCTPLEDFVVGRDNPTLLTSAIDDLQPRGSTDLDAGLREGYRIANARTDSGDRNRRMLLISDALLNTGEVDPDVVSEVGKAYEKSNIRLSAIGVGREFNDKVLDMLSEKGKGAYVYLGSEAVVDRIFGPGFDSLTQTIAHDVRFQLDLPPSLAMERFYGEESSTVKEDVQPIHYYAGTTQLFLQDLRIRDGVVREDPVKLTVEWSDTATGKPRTQVFTSTVGRLVDADPRNLHKGRALMAWTDLVLARSLGADPCGAPFSTWERRVEELGEDAEIAWLDGLTAPLCGRDPASTKAVATRGVPYKVKVDSDTVIAEVGLECEGGRQRATIGRSDSVARFDVEPGACSLVLYGAVPMVAEVSVPRTGGDVRCLVRGGRVSCS